MKSLKSIFDKNNKSQFRQNFIKVAKANAVAKLLPFIAAPFITRLFQPDDFATVAFFTAILGIASSVSTARFDWSIPNAKSNSMALSLFILGGLCLLTVIAFTSIFILLVKVLGMPWKSLSELGYFLYFLPLGIFFLGGQYLLEGWIIRSNDLTIVSNSRILESIVNVSGRLSTGFMGMSSLGLMSTVLLASFVSFLYMIRGSQAFNGLSRGLNSYRIWTAWMRYRRQAGLSTIVSVINATSSAMPLLLIMKFYSAKEVGWYVLMVALAYGPVSVLSSALAQSFWGEAARLMRNRDASNVRRLYLRTTLRLAKASVIIIIVCMAGPWFVGPMLGYEEWSGAGLILMVMAPAIVGSFIFTSTNHLVVYGKQGLQIISDLISIISSMLIIILSGQLELKFELTVFMYSITLFFTSFLRFYFHLLANSNYSKKYEFL